jgi:hypothetical protein
MSNPKKPKLVGTGVQKGLIKTPVYDAEFFEAEAKRRDRGLGLGWHIGLLFVMLTALLVAVIGWAVT